VNAGEPDPRVRRLPVFQFTADAFGPYGAVIGPEEADSPNLNRAPGNLAYLWIQKALEFPRQPYVGCVRYYQRAMRCEFLQKHPDSTIFLVPLSAQASVIYVATDDEHDRPDLETARAFLLTGGRGLILDRGVWIRYAYPLGAFADFAYITQRVDPATANVSDDVVRCGLVDTFGLALDIAFEAPQGYDLGAGGAVVAGPPHQPPFE